MSDDLKDEMDRRRHEFQVPNRSQYVQEALRVRFLLEDNGEWEDRLNEADHDQSDKHMTATG